MPARAGQLTPVFAKGIKPMWLMTLIGLTLFLINRLSAIYCLFDHYFLNGAGLIFPCDNMKQPGDYIFFLLIPNDTKY